MRQSAREGALDVPVPPHTATAKPLWMASARWLVDEEEAEVVRAIYRLYLQGKGKIHVDNHFRFDSKVSNETPWDAEPDLDKRRILRMAHPLGKRLISNTAQIILSGLHQCVKFTRL